MLISSPHNLNLCSDFQDTRFLWNVFEAVQKTRSTCFIGFKNTRLRLVFLNPIKHCCSCFKQYIKHSSHLRTLEKCRKHSPAARAFHISLVFSYACRVLSQCNTRLRLLYLLNKTWKKRVLLFCACKIHILKQMKKPKPCITL